MTWVKLPNAGDSLTMLVKQCGEAPGRLGEQVRFDSARDETVYMPRPIAQHWLSELGFGPGPDAIDYNAVCGRTLRLSRVSAPDPRDRPHWRVELAGKTPVQKPVHEESPVLNDHLPPAPMKPVVQVSAKRERLIEIAQAYEWATKVAMDTQKKVKGVKPTAESIQQGVTTLMLRAERMNAI